MHLTSNTCLQDNKNDKLLLAVGVVLVWTGVSSTALETVQAELYHCSVCALVVYYWKFALCEARPYISPPLVTC